MKTIIVTAGNIASFSPYIGTTKKLSIGEVLTVFSENIPKVRVNGCFAIVTDMQPSDNTQRMIERENHPDAEKYGWDRGAAIAREAIKNNEIYAMNKYSIDQTFLTTPKRRKQ